MAYEKKVSPKNKPLTNRRTTKTPPSKKKKTAANTALKWFQIALLCVIVIAFIFIGKYGYDLTKNPLIGVWRAETALGILEVEFDAHSMKMFGAKTPVSYEVEEKRVIVLDTDIKVGQAYQIIDNNTMSTEAGKNKTVYKRVK